MNARRVFHALLLGGALLAGCASQEPAPIEGKGAATPPVQRSVRPPLVRAPKPGANAPEVYRVVSGDTLYSIAFRFGVDPHRIAEWNSLANPNRIFVGQELRLRPRQALRAAGGATPAPPAAAPTPPLPSPPATPSAPRVAAVPPSSTAPQAAPVAPSPAPTMAVTGGTRNAGGVNWTWPASGKTRRAIAVSGSEGLEILGTRGQPVLAAGAGQVVYSGNGLRGYGQLIIIKHNDTFLSAYAHNDKLLVAEGTRVNAGQQIAEMGDSEASEVMLHFEIRKSGKAVGPLQFLPQR